MLEPTVYSDDVKNEPNAEPCVNDNVKKQESILDDFVTEELINRIFEEAYFKVQCLSPKAEEISVDPVNSVSSVSEKYHNLNVKEQELILNNIVKEEFIFSEEAYFKDKCLSPKTEVISFSDLNPENGGKLCFYCGRQFSCRDLFASHLDEHYKKEEITIQEWKSVLKNGEISSSENFDLPDVQFEDDPSSSRNAAGSSCSVSSISNNGNNTMEPMQLYYYQCSICSYVANDTFILTSHMRTRHSIKKVLYQCAVCDHSTKQKRALVRHMKTHCDGKPHKCSICEYSAKRKTNIVRHMRMHKGERPHRCMLCGYAATQKTHLNRHMLRWHPINVDTI